MRFKIPNDTYHVLINGIDRSYKIIPGQKGFFLFKKEYCDMLTDVISKADIVLESTGSIKESFWCKAFTIFTLTVKKNSFSDGIINLTDVACIWNDEFVINLCFKFDIDYRYVPCHNLLERLKAAEEDNESEQSVIDGIGTDITKEFIEQSVVDGIGTDITKEFIEQSVVDGIGTCITKEFIEQNFLGL